MNQFVVSTSLPVDCARAFAYHDRPGALVRLTPPWKSVSIEHSDQSLKPGSNVVLKANIGPVPLRWVAEHLEYDPPHLFSDRQNSGPFAEWLHKHRFDPEGPDRCVLTDEISYQLPLGFLGRLFGRGLARKELETMFAYRHRVTRDDLAAGLHYAAAPLRIAISGCSGLVGGRLACFLRLLGHHVIRLERSIDRLDTSENSKELNAVAPWSSSEQMEKLSGVDAVVHLAGKSIAGGRWNDQIKKEIRDSRIDLTTQLAEGLSQLAEKPKTFICASAVGIYGDRGSELLDESAELGDDFLADVAADWENACGAARDAGIRVANARLGLVLDPSGGALQKSLLPAKFCGGKLGSGSQWWSWIAIDDVIGAIYHAICCSEVSGPFNVTAPNPVTNREFASTLGQNVSRPALIPAPAFGLRFALGEMADALLLSSTRVVPDVLKSTGYTFRFEQLDDALSYCLGKNRLESVV